MIIPRPPTNRRTYESDETAANFGSARHPVPDHIQILGPYGVTKEYCDWVFELPSWRCAKCNGVMHGLMEHCVHCWLTRRERIERPK